jgi:hypothetical protein
MRNRAVSMRGQKHHLVFPGIRIQRPAVTEDHGLTRSPVLEIDLRSVFRRNSRHWNLSLFSPYRVGEILLAVVDVESLFGPEHIE